MNDWKCVLCRKNPWEMLYAVDPRKEDKPICGPCFGRWDPPRLDDLLGVRQKEPKRQPAPAVPAPREAPVEPPQGIL